MDATQYFLSGLMECLGTWLRLRSQKILNFFLLKFNMVCTFWIVLMCWCQKWFLKNEKNHWHAFWHEKLFEKHPQPHCQTRSNHKKHDPWTCYKLIENSWITLLKKIALFFILIWFFLEWKWIISTINPKSTWHHPIYEFS
jgi:hypothetical protein